MYPKNFQLPADVREFLDRYCRRDDWSTTLDETINFESEKWFSQYSCNTRALLKETEYYIHEKLHNAKSCIIGSLYVLPRAECYESKTSKYACRECVDIASCLYNYYEQQNAIEFTNELRRMIRHFKSEHKRHLKKPAKVEVIP